MHNISLSLMKTIIVYNYIFAMILIVNVYVTYKSTDVPLKDI